MFKRIGLWMSMTRLASWLSMSKQERKAWKLIKQWNNWKITYFQLACGLEDIGGKEFADEILYATGEANFGMIGRRTK